ncbi:MAG: hypothetical protein GY847_42055 [Proteobacteria bacterium]|nr:hypothetical protein [Pseudomonadota bacterium]
MMSEKKTQVWHALLDADASVRYWRKLAHRYSKIDRMSKIFLAIFTTATVGSWLGGYPLYIKIISSLAAAVGFTLPILGWAELSSKMATLCGRWTAQMNGYSRLWIDLETSDDFPIEPRFSELQYEKVQLNIEEATLPELLRIKKRCQEEVRKARGIHDDG